MLLWRVGLVLVAAAFQTLDKCLAGISRSNDVVDETKFSSAIRVVELCLILLDALGLLFGCLLAIEDRHSALGSHHGNLGTLVGEVDICSELLAVHHDVGATISLAGDEGDLRHSGLGKGVEQLGTMANDAAMLLVDARHKARNVFDGDDRDVEAVAETHEACALLRCVDIEGSSQYLGLIGDETNSAACHAR